MSNLQCTVCGYREDVDREIGTVVPCPQCGDSTKIRAGSTLPIPVATAIPYAEPSTPPAERLIDRTADLASAAFVPMAGERLILQLDGCVVTDARVIIAGTTHAVANVTTVSTAELSADFTPAMWAIALGVTVMIVTLIASPALLVTLLWILLGGALCFAGIYLIRQSRPTFALRLSTAAGEIDAIKSDDRELIVRLNAAVAEAIVSRRQL